MKFNRVFLGLFVFSTWTSANVRLVGSDLLGEVLKPSIEAEAARRDWDLQIDFGG
jgi:hypothetical protein|tara:strand:- start:1149 stop:1313 length:165 start_codon:yes stop_codon:yes gene_type:complete